MEVLIGEAKKEFNTEVTENTENAEKKRKQERGAGAQRSRCLRNFEAALQEAEEKVGEESEEGSGDGAGEDESIADEGDAAEDEGAEAAGANGRGDGGDADGDDGGGANAGKDDGERERETNAEEDLRASHAHGLGRFKDGGIDAGEADVGVAQDGKKRVEDEGDDGGALADAADKRNRNQEAEEGEAGDGLENAGDAQRDGAQRWALHNEHAERDADEDGNNHGDEDEHEVIERGAENFFAVSGEERQGGHLGAHAGATGGMARDEVKARTSGWSRRRNSCGAALATMRPASSRTMREARSSASRRSWVTKTMVLPRRRARALNSRWSSARVTGSSAPKGSSMSRMGGSAARARATPTRWRWPPESSRGRRAANLAGSRPTRRNNSSTRAAIREASHFSSAGTRPIFSATVKWGNSPAS